jgi:hypothetical protein
VLGAVDLAVVVVDAPGRAPALERSTEDQLEGGQLAAEAEAAVQEQAAVVVEEGIEPGAP